MLCPVGIRWLNLCLLEWLREQVSKSTISFSVDIGVRGPARVPSADY